MRLPPSQEAKEDHLPNPLQARKEILSLRNPNEKPQGRSIHVAEAFELPTRAPHKVQAHSPMAPRSRRGTNTFNCRPDPLFHIRLFEVLTLQALHQQ
jgi:hypothetical protein